MNRRLPMLSLTLVAVSAPSAGVAKSGEVQMPFIDGMTIHTANVIANVEIQAKSFGPGACAVEFITNGARIQILAPPAGYSNWQVLTASVGKNAFTISQDVKCDTGVLARVKYWKEMSNLRGNSVGGARARKGGKQ